MHLIHALTPGDHFSPRTGSAIATVVHGLSRHSTPRPSVLVASGTYADRYDSAEPVEYQLRDAPYGASRRIKTVDVVLGRVGLPRPWARRVYGQMVEEQSTWSPSYIVAHNGPQLVPLIEAPHLSVLYVHNNLFDWYGRREVQKVLSSAYRIVCVSSYTAARLLDKAPALAERTRVVHNGVDMSLFHRKRVERSGPLRVGYIGRVIPDKGVHVLLESLGRLDRADIEAVIIGSSGFSADGALTAYEQELRAQAQKIKGTVRFVPFQPRWRLPDLYAQLDVAVVPSIRPEAFALTILEAMAAEVAVIFSDIGGTAEAAGGAGRMVRPGDVEGLAAALEDLANSPGLVSALGKQGVLRAQERTWAHSASDLAEALD